MFRSRSNERSENMDNHSDWKTNLHTHTSRCGHASGTPDELCKAALDSGLRTLGFSDHGPFPDNGFCKSRMDFSELPDYCRDIREARKKYPDLTIFAGLEIEYRPAFSNEYYQDYLFGELDLDYLIGAAHYAFMPDGTIHPFYGRSWETPEVLNEFVRQTIRTMEKLPILYMAHPDCMGHVAGKITPELKSGFRDIIAAAADLHIPLEINANGLRKPMLDTEDGKRFCYPLESFWELAAENGKIRTVIGTDAHSVDVIADFKASAAFARKFGLKICNDEVAEELAVKLGTR